MGRSGDSSLLLLQLRAARAVCQLLFQKLSQLCEVVEGFSAAERNSETQEEGKRDGVSNK